MLPLGHGYEVKTWKTPWKGYYAEVFLNGQWVFETPGGARDEGDAVQAARLMMYKQLEMNEHGEDTVGEKEAKEEAGSQAQE
jgi:hypothetical protein